VWLPPETAQPIRRYLIVSLRTRSWRCFMVMDMTMMSTGMMVGMVIYHLIIVIFALLGIAAFIKYLRS
jgi:lipid-binding SYLF domain-containing protein